RRLLNEARGAMRHLVHAAPVDHAGQMRPVLLGGADRHDDDGVALSQRLDLPGLQPRPFYFGHSINLFSSPTLELGRCPERGGGVMSPSMTPPSASAPSQAPSRTPPRFARGGTRDYSEGRGASGM